VVEEAAKFMVARKQTEKKKEPGPGTNIPFKVMSQVTCFLQLGPTSMAAAKPVVHGLSVT
jgi:hypothetical protein